MTEKNGRNHKTHMKRRTGVPVVLFVVSSLFPVSAYSQNLTLDRVVSMYIERNLELQAARYKLERTKADQIAASLRPNPSVSITGENFRVSGPIAFGNLYEVAT